MVRQERHHRSQPPDDEPALDLSALDNPDIGIVATPDGKGYWEYNAGGGIFSFGDARFFGSAGGTKLNQPAWAIAAS